VLSLLETHVKSTKMSATESQIERHIQNSNTKDLIALEPVCQESQRHKSEPQPETTRPPQQVYPLTMVLDACPDIVDYAKGGILNWRDLQATVIVVCTMLGITPSAWNAAKSAMGEIPAAIVVAGILQKGTKVTSAGGYLRDLTNKAEQGRFKIGPMLMALISARKRERKRA